MTIDNLLPDTWPADAVDALDRWHQGHLIRCDIAAWVASARTVDPVTGLDPIDYGDGMIASAADVDDTGYFAVVSQTCDIAAAGPGMRHPFVQICPVRDAGAAFPAEKVKLIRDGEIVEYVYLTNPPEIGKDWAIDLRMSVPLSKGVLVQASPIEGFSSEEDELELAGRVAAKFERPALRDYISKDLIDGLNDFVSRARRNDEDWCEEIEQLRLQIEGNRLTPKRVRLMVVTDVDFNGFLISKKIPLRTYWKSHKKPMRRAGIEQAPIAFRNIDKWTAKDYRNSLPLYISSLGRGRFN